MRHRHTPEEIVSKLDEATTMLQRGMRMADVAKALGVSEATFHRWRADYGNRRDLSAHQFKELQTENLRLRRQVAEQELHLTMLEEIARGNF